MNLTLKLNEIDYSSFLPRHGYSVTYRKILGSNSVTTLDGTYHEDILAYKGTITTELRPMTSAQLSALETSCADCETATYFDTKMNQVVTKNVIVLLSKAMLVLNTSESTLWNASTSSGITLMIEER